MNCSRRTIFLARQAVPALVETHVGEALLRIDGEQIQRARVDAHLAPLCGDTLVRIDDNGDGRAIGPGRHANSIPPRGLRYAQPVAFRLRRSRPSQFYPTS